jgi:hypothetical protein
VVSSGRSGRLEVFAGKLRAKKKSIFLAHIVESLIGTRFTGSWQPMKQKLPIVIQHEKRFGRGSHLRSCRATLRQAALERWAAYTIMKTLRTPAIVLTALCASFLIYLVYSAVLLPERMATHFGCDGQPDGWMSRSADLVIFGVLGIGLPLLFAGSSIVTRFLPPWFINISHREYWLSPERLPQTRAYIARQLLWMGCLMVLFLAGMHYLTIQANRITPAHLPMDLFLTVLGGFLAGVGIWSFIFIRHFTKAA